MNFKKIALYFLLFLFARYCRADNRIVIQLRHAPEIIKTEVISETKNNNQEDPELLAKKIAPSLSGFVTMYGGYWTRSKEDGYISFPLRHTSKKLYLAITPKIELLKPRGDTISHNKYSIEANNPTKLYLFEQKEDTKEPAINATMPTGETVDPKGKLKNVYWSTKEVPLPAGNIIDPLTVVILSDPKNLIIDTTDQKVTPNPQLVIPDIFVVGSKNKTKIMLEVMDISRYFEHLETESKPSDPASEPSMRKLINNR